MDKIHTWVSCSAESFSLPFLRGSKLTLRNTFKIIRITSQEYKKKYEDLHVVIGHYTSRYWWPVTEATWKGVRLESPARLQSLLSICWLLGNHNTSCNIIRKLLLLPAFRFVSKHVYLSRDFWLARSQSLLRWCSSPRIRLHWVVPLSGHCPEFQIAVQSQESMQVGDKGEERIQLPGLFSAQHKIAEAKDFLLYQLDLQQSHHNSGPWAMYCVSFVARNIAKFKVGLCKNTFQATAKPSAYTAYEIFDSEMSLHK